MALPVLPPDLMPSSQSHKPAPPAADVPSPAAPRLRYVDRARRSTIVVDRVLEGIAGGAFPVGSPLPSERVLAEMLGVSRGTVREGLRILEHAGVVDVRTGAGTFPTSRARDGASQLRARAAALGDVSPLDLMAARLALEPTCAAQAAEHARPDHLQAMEENMRAHVAACERGETGDDFDLAFHALVARASGNPVLVDLLDQLRPAMRAELWSATRQGVRARRGRGHDCIALHRVIVDAIAAGHPEPAEAAMRTHLQTVGQKVLDQLEVQE